VNSSSNSFGTGRERPTSVSFADIEAAARKLMTAGDYPSVATVRKELKRGSTTTIADAMRRFWKDQAALNAGNPVALTRLPPEFADAAVALWEQALRLSLQTAQQDDSAARAKLEELRRDTDARARSLELREKEWDMAARVRERALADTREQVNMLLKELANATAEIRANKVQIADLQSQIEDYRRQLATVIARAVSRHRAPRATKPSAQAKSKKRRESKKSVTSKRALGRRKR
jgi:hypothetical protein